MLYGRHERCYLLSSKRCRCGSIFSPSRRASYTGIYLRRFGDGTLKLPSLTPSDIRAIEDVLAFCIVIHTNPRITRLAGELRRLYRVKTIDAIIAATALFASSTLLTRNVRDFKKIPSLEVERV
ncbi:MAG: PIN domain-containing protein [Minisyncoccia bacterium]